MKASIQIPGEDSTRRLAIKSGFVSLQERLRFLAEQQETSSKSNASSRRQKQQAAAAPQQFATLQEFFQSKSSLRKQQEINADHQQQSGRRHKVPVMRLTKDDWNVRCWEERLGGNNKPHGIRKLKEADKFEGPNRAVRPEKQVKVFTSRIEDVAGKLEKVREGLPLDEQLYKLSRKKVESSSSGPSSHSWTDLLKSELAKGVHNSKVLRSQVLAKTRRDSGEQPQGDGAVKTRVVFFKSPLGRPIRRLSCEDEEEEATGQFEQQAA